MVNDEMKEVKEELKEKQVPQIEDVSDEELEATAGGMGKIGIKDKNRVDN
jgi:hypothetical protein